MSTNLPWLTKELKHLVLLKKLPHARFKSSLNMCDYKAFSSLWAKFKYLSKKCFRVSVCNVVTSLKNNHQNFWKFIKTNISNNNISRVFGFNECFATDESDSVMLFASYFFSVYSSEIVDLDVNSFSIPSFDLLSKVSLNVNNVFHKLSMLRGFRSIRSNSLPGEILFQFPSIISYQICLLFKRSLWRRNFSVWI